MVVGHHVVITPLPCLLNFIFYLEITETTFYINSALNVTLSRTNVKCIMHLRSSVVVVSAIKLHQKYTRSMESQLCPQKLDREMSRLIAAGNDKSVAWLDNNTDNIFIHIIFQNIFFVSHNVIFIM